MKKEDLIDILGTPKYNEIWEAGALKSAERGDWYGSVF